MVNDFRNLPPSQKADAIAEATAKAKGRVRDREAMLREDFGRTFQTAHGKRVLAYIAGRCGWRKPVLAANQQGVIDPMITTHNAMELGLYLHITQFIPVDVLMQVEYGEIKPSGTIDEKDDAVQRKPKKSNNKTKE